MFLVSLILASVTLITLIDAKVFSEQQFKDTSGMEDAENISSNKLDTDKVLRLKRSNYPEPYCDSCRYSRNQYEPPMVYSDSNSDSRDNYNNFPSKYSGETPAYSTPNHEGHSYRPFDQSPSSFNSRYYNLPSYNEPSYQSPSHQSQSYQSTSYHSPSYQPPGYHSPNNYPPRPRRPFYYNPLSQHSPNHHSLGYNPSNHQQPNSYNRHPDNYQHQPRNSIASSNLVIGCSPHVSMLPEKRYSQQPYNQAQQHQISSSAYRSHSSEQESDAKQSNADGNSESEPGPVKDTPTKIASAAEAKLRQPETLIKMAQYHDRLVKDAATSGEGQKKEWPKAVK